MTAVNPGPATQTTGNVAGGPYAAWNNTAGTGLIGPTGPVIALGGGPGGGVALFDGVNSITSGTAQFSNANGVTFGINGQTITASAAGVGGVAVSVSNSSYSSGTLTFQNANGVSFGSSGANGISASYTVPVTAGLISGLNVSGGAGNSQSKVSGITFSNSNGLTFGVSTGASVVTVTGSYTVPVTAGLISALAVSGGAGNSNTVTGMTFQNSNGLTFGVSTGASAASITASYTVPTQTNQTVGLYGVGNTTQNSSTTLDARTVSFDGLGAMTVGFSNGSVQLSVPVTSSLSGTGLVSVAVNASTISIGAQLVQLSFFQPIPSLNTTVTQNGLGSVQVYPAPGAFPFTATRADIFASVSLSTIALSSDAEALSLYVGLYSLNGSTLSLASSGSQSYQWTNSSNNSAASISGMRRFSAPINVNYTGGYDLFVGVMTNTTFTNTNAASLSNVVVPLGPGPQLQGLIGQTQVNSMQFVPGQGFFSVTSAALPGSIGLTQISGAGSGGNAVDYYAPVVFVNVTA